MKPSFLVRYSLVALIALAPLGIRVVTWPGPRPSALEPSQVQTGKMLFLHEWKANDPLCAGGDGLGPVYNATSCVACHKQGGTGGAGGLEHNVTVFVRDNVPPGPGIPRQGVVHAMAVGPNETLRDLSPNLPAISQPTLAMLIPERQIHRLGRGHVAIEQRQGAQLVQIPPGLHLSQRNTPALFGANLIDEIPDSVIIAGERAQRVRWGGAPSDVETLPAGRALRLPDGRVGHFGWKAQSASLSDFVRAACAGELGLSNPGQAQPQPLNRPAYVSPGFDLTAQQCDQMTAFVAALPRPVERKTNDPAAAAGKQLFHTIGCADCHTPSLGSVEGLYSDLLVHRMGSDLEGGGSYNQPSPGLPESPGDGPLPDEWRTPPLWGVADSAPYLHDGRAPTLEQAILLHQGQATRAAARFHELDPVGQGQVIAFLKSLRAP